MSTDHELERGCRFDLTVTALFRDEAPYLREWVEFHRMVGVDRFVLVNDRSTDDFATELEPYVRAGTVDLVDCPCPAEFQGRHWIEFQRAVLADICDQLIGVTRWLALVDVDEFLVPTGQNSLLDVLADYEGNGGVFVPWEAFGTSYVVELGAADLLTNRLRLRQRTLPTDVLLGKSVVKPHRVATVNIHRCEYAPGFDCADVEPNSSQEVPPLVLHHYWTRDEHHLLTQKLPRCVEIKGWNIDAAVTDHFRTVCNEVADTCMDRHLPGLMARLGSGSMSA